jgi:flagellar biosynthesis/type III secretory pathway chaperone
MESLVIIYMGVSSLSILISGMALLIAFSNGNKLRELTKEKPEIKVVIPKEKRELTAKKNRKKRRAKKKNGKNFKEYVRITPEIAKTVISLKDAGVSNGEISKSQNISKASVYNIVSGKHSIVANKHKALFDHVDRISESQTRLLN